MGVYIENIINKTKYLIYIFYKISKFMPTNTLKMIYYALFHSIISYGITVWGGAYRNNLSLLQNIQNRILKIVYQNNFVQAKPLNLQQLFANECLKYYHAELKNIYINSTSKTRNKSIILPKI